MADVQKTIPGIQRILEEAFAMPGHHSMEPALYWHPRMAGAYLAARLGVPEAASRFEELHNTWFPGKPSLEFLTPPDRAKLEREKIKITTKIVKHFDKEFDKLIRLATRHFKCSADEARKLVLDYATSKRRTSEWWDKEFF